jgi:hypothetical protein
MDFSNPLNFRVGLVEVFFFVGFVNFVFVWVDGLMLSVMRGRIRERKKMGEKEQYNIHNRRYSELSYIKVHCSIFNESLYFEVSAEGT